MRISRREHQQPALAGALDEGEPEPRLGLDLPSVAGQALDRRRHGAGWVRGGIQATRLDHLPLKAKHSHPARPGVVGVNLVTVPPHRAIVSPVTVGRLFSSR